MIWSPSWRRVRRLLLIVVTLVVLYTLAGFVGIPLLIGHELRGRLAQALARPISVRQVRFNPYSLRLDLDRLAIANRGQPGQFVQIDHLRLIASWASLTHLAPVVRQLTIERPRLMIVRGSQGFNFADLIAPKTTGAPAHTSSFHFAMANIELHDGSISFDDQVLKSRHHIEQMQLGIPFIANLPSELDVYVQPRLAMLVDGSPFRLTGKSKLFGASRDSFINLKFQNLDLARFSAYLPPSAPVRLGQGSLSTDLQIDFAEHAPQMLIRIAGRVALDRLDLRTPTQAPLLALNHGEIVMIDVQPLEKIAKLREVNFDGLTANLVLLPGGATNLGALTASSPAPAGASSPPLQFSLDALALTNGTIEVTDQAAATPVSLALRNLHLSLSHVANNQGPPAPFDVGTQLSSGGQIEAKGSIDLAQEKIAGHAALNQIDLAALNPLAQPYLVAGLANGSLDGQGDFTVALGASRQMRVQTASAQLNEVELRDPAHGQSPLRWKRLSVSGAKLDLLAHQASVDRVSLEQPQVSVRRQRDGTLSLAALVRMPTAQAANTSPQGSATTAPPPAPWQYQVGTAAISDGQAQVEDDSGPQPLRFALSALNLQVHDLTPDLSRPIPLTLATAVDKRGHLKASGTIAPSPLQANLRTQVSRLPLANEVNAYLTSLINAQVSSAFADESGTIRAKLERGRLHATYRGDASLTDVRLTDSKGRTTFLEWGSLRARRTALTLGTGPFQGRIGELDLSRFFGQLMLDSRGRLSVRNLFVTAPAAPSTPAATPSSGHPLAAHLGIDRIAFDHGRINWTDHFVRPNYSAALTDLHGTVGAISTDSEAHAPVSLQGHVNQSATISIEGRISPLAPMAFVDLTADASGVSLPNLTPYSVKYTGYPIEEGTLSLKVHYLLDHRRLTAQNHIVINQLTFGPQVESKSAINLPIRLAVALLKDPNGRIRVDVPVSGSLADPEFSLGQALLNGFVTLITKAATAPFSLLASAFDGKSKELSYIQFAPGSTKLSSEAIDKLSTLAKALEQRPSLDLAIGGRADPALDTNGARKALLEKRVRQAKIAYLLSKGRRVDRASIEVSPSEYNEYLKMAYKAADFSKPRDFLGLEKSLPPAEMEKLLLEHTQVKPEDLLALANQRAGAVRHWLAAKVSPNRLLVTSPKLVTSGNLPAGEGTRVKLALE